jgi:hypothetical protein
MVRYTRTHGIRRQLYTGRYCLSHHIQSADLGHRPIDANAGTQGPRQIDHRCSLRDHDGLPGAAAAPTARPTMGPFKAIGVGRAPHARRRRYHPRVGLPALGTVTPHVPAREAVDPRWQGGCLTTLPCPRQERAGITLSRCPAPEYAACLGRLGHRSASAMTTVLPRRLGLTACAGAERRRPFSTALARTGHPGSAARLLHAVRTSRQTSSPSRW